MMMAFLHMFGALFYGHHNLLQDTFGRVIVINIQWLFKFYGQQGARLSYTYSLLFECPPESSNHDGYNNGLVLFYDVSCSFTPRGKRLGCPLRKGNYPAIIQCTFYLPCIRGIQTFSLYGGIPVPGTLHRY